MNNINIKVYQLGYFIKWVPQEAYYYSVEHTNFKARPFRTQELTVSIIVLMIKLMIYIIIQHILNLELVELLTIVHKRLEIIILLEMKV